MSEFLLPTHRFTYSQQALWERSKKEYVERYFKGLKSGGTFQSEDGKLVESMLENGGDITALESHQLDRLVSDEGLQEAISKTSVLPYNSTPLSHKLPELTAFGIADFTDDPDKVHQIQELKTGWKEWNQARVNNHDQLAMYALLTYMSKGHIPEITLKWLEKERTEVETPAGKQVRGVFTGNVFEFERPFTSNELKEYRDKMIETAYKISQAWRHYNGMLPEVKPDVINEYMAAYVEAKNQDGILKSYASQIKTIMTNNNLPYIETPEGYITLVERNTFSYGDAVDQKEAELKRLKQELEALKEAAKNEGLVTFKSKSTYPKFTPKKIKNNKIK